MHKTRWMIAALPLAALVAVGNVAHVDPASGSTTVLIGGQRTAASGDQYSSWTITIAATAARLGAIALAKAASYYTAGSGIYTAATEASPTVGLFMRRNANTKDILNAIRSAEAPEPTSTERLKTLND